MKYINFKRYKFFTLYKSINFARFFKVFDLRNYKFSKIFRFWDFKKYSLSRIINYFNPDKYKFSKIFRFLNFKKYNLFRIINYFNPRNYKFFKIREFFGLKIYRYFFLYFLAIVIFSGLMYLSIPIFFNYDKSKFENIVCRDLNFKCKIGSKIHYSFFPSPRIKFNNFIIKDLSSNQITLAEIEKVAVKISLLNLFNKGKFNYKSIVLSKAEVNLDFKELDQYQKIYSKKFNLKPVSVKSGKINFFDNKKYIADITDIKFNHKPTQSSTNSILKGKFLNDKMYLKVKHKKNDKKDPLSIVFKLLNTKLLTKIDIFNLPSKTDPISGNIVLKKDKSRLTGNFDYKDAQLVFKNANLANFFLDGTFDGNINFLPYFNFDLDVALKAINFNKFYNFVISLDEQKKKKFFKINKKINGQLSLSTNKIYSKYGLIKSFESRSKFINGNISIEQLIFDLGKLGAADLLGIIKNDGKFTNFKFENNIFIDNQKYFFSKFGIYNKKNIPSSLFISGNVDLVNLNMHLYEISLPENKKFSKEDVNYIEKEFNDSLFEDGYKSFFNFLKLKEYIKLVAADMN